MTLSNYDFNGFTINLYVDEQGDWLAHFRTKACNRCFILHLFAIRNDKATADSTHFNQLLSLCLFAPISISIERSH